MGLLSRRLGAAGARTTLLGLLVITAAACGSGTAAPHGSITTPLATAATETVRPAPAGPTPSASAQMICGAETQHVLVYTLGERPVAPVVPRWQRNIHLYSCDYRYRSGIIALSVKELSSGAETAAYYAQLARALGRTGTLPDLGQGAFTTRDGSVVVRKDWRVLLVDVSGLPAEFGSPQTSAADVAITVADVVIACWTGN